MFTDKKISSLIKSEASDELASIKLVFRAYHLGKIEATERELERLLGINYAAEGKVNIFKLTERFGNEQYRHETTPFEYCRFFLNFLNVSASDKIFDLGSGFGKIVLYGSLVTNANFTGIEIVPEREKEAERVKKMLELVNANFICQNILAANFEDGNIFFLFNPFATETLEKVGKKLREIAENKEIKIITWGGPSNYYFERQSWLSEIPHSGPKKLQIFESIK